MRAEMSAAYLDVCSDDMCLYTTCMCTDVGIY
jgi:hypothetical protein